MHMLFLSLPPLLAMLLIVAAVQAPKRMASPEDKVAFRAFIAGLGWRPEKRPLLFNVDTSPMVLPVFTAVGGALLKLPQTYGFVCYGVAVCISVWIFAWSICKLWCALLKAGLSARGTVLYTLRYAVPGFVVATGSAIFAAVIIAINAD